MRNLPNDLTRKRAIEILADGMVDDLSDDLYSWGDIVLEGFKGFNNFTNEELEKEFIEREETVHIKGDYHE